MIHNVQLTDKAFYDFWQGYRTAIVVPYNKDYKQWDTMTLSCDSPKWKDIPIYYKISFIEYIGMNEVLLHLKR